MVFALSFPAPKVIINLITTMNRKAYKEIKSLLAVRPAYTQTEIGRMVGMAQPNISLVHTTKNFKAYKQHLRDVWAQRAKEKQFKEYGTIPEALNKEELLRLAVELGRMIDNMKEVVKLMKGGLKWIKNE